MYQQTESPGGGEVSGFERIHLEERSYFVDDGVSGEELILFFLARF
jgi:hypothetical protein